MLSQEHSETLVGTLILMVFAGILLVAGVYAFLRPDRVREWHIRYYDAHPFSKNPYWLSPETYSISTRVAGAGLIVISLWISYGTLYNVWVTW